jgi:hypothetical protein
MQNLDPLACVTHSLVDYVTPDINYFCPYHRLALDRLFSRPVEVLMMRLIKGHVDSE